MQGVRTWRIAAILVFLLATALPGSASAQAAGERDRAGVPRGPDEEPWLRIEAGGHTATVRALAFTPDSGRLCSGGLDKNVEVWNLAALRDLRRIYLRERTIRWQVARGLRGNIYALAAAPTDGLLAIGGYGAMGSLGEILLVNPVDGKLVKVLEGHRQTVCSLAFSPDGEWLASTDTAGEARLWKRGAWNSTVLYGQDSKTYGPEQAALIQKQPKFRPVVFAAGRRVVVPGFVGRAANGLLQWRLVQIRADDTKDFRALETIHHGMVTAMASSTDGSRLASADSTGRLHVWDLSRGGGPDSLQPGGGVLSLAFSPDGRTLVAGTLVGGPKRKGQVQVWDLATRTLARTVLVPDHVYACAVSPDGKRLAYTGGDQGEAFVAALAGGEEPAVLRGIGRRIGRVAFAKEEPGHRVAFAVATAGQAMDDSGDFEESFDPARLALGEKRPVAADWIPAGHASGGWTVRPQNDGSLQLVRDGVPQGTVAIRPQVPGLEEGRPRCHCWLPGPDGSPAAIVVGTALQDSIYVCRIARSGPCPILRHFRGHSDAVLSVGASRDARYLVSGSADGTVRFWSLAEYAHETASRRKWGATFAVREGRLVATDVHPAGPLFQKGMRNGDTLTVLRWPSGGTEQTEGRAAQMLEKLQTLPWGTQVVFEYSRNGVARPPFQLLPAWQPLATLFVGSNREWAFWTPEGYYDASMNGHRLFGWQVNRGLQRLPDFYRADQFQKELERPRVLERLLPAGSLDEALRQAGAARDVPSDEVLPAQISATPKIEILAPAPGTVVQGDASQVKARIEVPAGRKLVQVRAFANGVISAKGDVLSEREVEGGREAVYQWNVPLPNDPAQLIQVVAGTDAATSAFDNVVIGRSPPAKPARLPELHAVCLGINRYSDPKIAPLAFSVADARAVAESLRSRAAGIYHVSQVSLLLDGEVTPAACARALQELCNRLKDRVGPDDLVLLFLAGHGIVDETTRRYYYVGHEFKVADLERRAYGDCISWESFRLLADVPCRKVVLLDTCHSGAVQPARSSDLKAAVRDLQSDVIFTLTASTGEQRAAEKAAWGHGAFTRCVLEAFQSRADAPRDAVVTLDQLAAYVKEAVPKLTSGLQTPTAAPDEILPFAKIPMVRRR